MGHERTDKLPGDITANTATAQWAIRCMRQFTQNNKLASYMYTGSDSCESTALKDRATGERGPATELELGTYALSWSFSHASQ